MVKKLGPQWVSMETPTESPWLPSVHCPICGEMASLDEDERRTPACPHAAFLYVGQVKKLWYGSKEFKKRSKGEKLKGLGLTEFKDLLRRLGYDNRLLVIAVKYESYDTTTEEPKMVTDAYGFDWTLSEDIKNYRKSMRGVPEIHFFTPDDAP